MIFLCKFLLLLAFIFTLIQVRRHLQSVGSVLYLWALLFLELCSGVARPLPSGGAEYERSEKRLGSGGLPPGKFLGATPFRRSENEGNALFSYILHINMTTLNTKGRTFFVNFDQEFILIIASYSKKAKEEFSFSYRRSNISSTKYEMDLLSFTAKWFGAGRSILIFKELSLSAILSLSSQSTESFARKLCKRNCSSMYRFSKSSFDEIFPE